MLLPLAGTIFGGGVAYQEVKSSIAEVSKDYRQHVVIQQRRELMQERKEIRQQLDQRPNDQQLLNALEENDRALQENREINIQLQKEKN